MHRLRDGDTENMNCDHVSTRYVRVRISNGTEQIRQRCIDCGDLFGQAYGRSRFHPEVIEAMPVVDNWTHDRPPCVVCGARGTEEHHWAPRALFGDEAFIWPTSWLCPACHQRWHQTVGASA